MHAVRLYDHLRLNYYNNKLVCTSGSSSPSVVLVCYGGTGRPTSRTYRVGFIMSGMIRLSVRVPREVTTPVHLAVRYPPLYRNVPTTTLRAYGAGLVDGS